MGWLIALGMIVLLAMFPLGISAKYQQSGFAAWVLVGPVRIQLYPSKQKEKEDDTGKKKTSLPQSPASKTNRSSPEERGGSWKDFLPLVDVLRDFLGDLRRKIRVKYLKLHVTMAGDDPCDLAVSYGCMNAAMAGLLAQLDRLFVIRRQDIRMNCDFTAEDTVVAARIDLTITTARALRLLARYGAQALKIYSSIKKQREGGANL